MKRFFIVLLQLTTIVNLAFSASWYSLNGKLARVEYQQPHRALADSLLDIAEGALPRLAALHGLSPEQLEKQQVRIILTDQPDISNGMALGNAVLIYAQSSMYMPYWTGNDSWYETVLTHELAHYVTFLKIRRKLNLLGQAINLTIPRWFFEGIAQYFAEDWNAYRGDLYIENALLAGKLNYNSLENLEDGRLLYAVGHAFIRYLATEQGDSSLIRLMSFKENGWYLDFKDAFKFVYGKKPAEKFTDFTRHMVLHYGSKLAEYPVDDQMQTLPPLGYNDFQMLPLSAADSTWLITTQLDKNHRYKSAILVRQKEKGFEKLDIISNNFNTDLILSPDKELAAYGRYHLSSAENQIHLDMDWFIYNLRSEQTKKITDNVRARSAAFTADKHLVLAETLPVETRFVQYDLNRQKKVIQHTTKPAGHFIILEDGSIIAGVQQKNGNRDLFHFKEGREIPLTDDETDDRNPLLLNDSIIIFNRYLNGRPAVAALNLKNKTQRIILNDRYPYFVRGAAADSGFVVLSRWGAARENQFFVLNADSLLKTNAARIVDLAHPELADWTRIAAESEVIHSADTVAKSEHKLKFPQFPLEHLLTFALPTQEPGAGWGIYGATSWIEALQRQALVAVFLLYKDYDKSLVTVQHLLKAFNGQLLSTYYHGPVIFGFEQGRYLHLLQDVAAFDWQYQWYFSGNPRTRFNASISYARYAYSSAKETFDDYNYHGPALQLSFDYLLPTRAYPALPKRQFSLATKFFKSVKKPYDFSIFGLSLKLATNLFLEEFGLKSHSVYLKQLGKLPPFKSVGVDRFYEFDIPRDYIFSRPIRGLRADISGKELFWNSTELVYLIDDHTPYKLISLPVNNLAISAFLDYAQVKNIQTDQVYSWGGELSFGEDILRLGLGYARVKDHLDNDSEQVYGRISVILP